MRESHRNIAPMFPVSSHSEAESHAWCKRVMLKEAKGFYFASRFLPRPKRLAHEALYGVFRAADDLADEPGFAPSERRLGLASIREDLANIRNPSHESAAPWFPAVRAAFARYPISIDDALRVIDGCAAEVDGVPIDSIDDLERCASMITGGVGRCGVVVLGASDPESIWRAEQIGVAMQLTNMLRDIEHDRQLGRDYLAFARHGDRDLLDVKRAIAQRAHARYAEGVQLAARLPNDGSRVTVMLAVDLYRALLERLERQNFDRSAGRPSIGRAELFWRALRTNLAALSR